MDLELSDQARNMLACDGPLLVLGGPGSGKTTMSLVKASQILSDLKSGQQILFLSFSRAAVRQVLLRCKDVLTFEQRKLITVKTYHAFGLEVLKAHGRLLSGSPTRILVPGAERRRKAGFDGDWEIERRRLATEEGLYVFDLFAEHAASLLDRASCVRDLLSDIYPVIILDEFQDTNDSQWMLVKELARSSRLIVLADPDQRIFEYDKTVDPARLDQLQDLLSPTPFDFGDTNHRSPDAVVLAFADAVLRNRLAPETSDVKVIGYFPRAFEATVHAAVVWTLSALRSGGIKRPSVAVLGRTNSLVAELSSVLDVEHSFKRTALAPVDHHVVWDAQLTASAAQVVASIMEWPQHPPDVAIAMTADAISEYYENKFADNGAASARATAEQYRRAAESLRSSGKSRLKAVAQLRSAFEAGLALSGDPPSDWLRARDVLKPIANLAEIMTSVRFVRLFRARDEIAEPLRSQWTRSGDYGDAQGIVRRALDLRLVQDLNADPAGVVLMTLHKSKGKEFDGVVIVEGLYRGKFFDEARESAPFEATRRLLRVGITRARSKVVIVRPQGAIPLTPEVT